MSGFVEFWVFVISHLPWRPMVGMFLMTILVLALAIDRRRGSRFLDRAAKKVGL